MSTETKVDATEAKPLTAADLLQEDHPLHKSFVKFCGDNEPSKRQARKFLQKYPQYRG